MSTKEKSPADRVFTWLKNNLGKRCLAPLTGQDAAALQAAAQVASVACYCDDEAPVVAAFGHLVGMMQPASRELAFHAIGMVRDWSFRVPMWEAAGLPAFTKRRLCNFERGGSLIEGAEARWVNVVRAMETEVAA